MAVDNIKNLAYSTVQTAPSPDTSGTSLVVQTGDGAKFPAGQFDVTIWPSAEIPLLSNAEICRATVAGDTFTLIRAQYGTTAQPIAVGWQIAQTLTGNLISEILAACDPAGSAATAQSNAETFATNAANTAQSNAETYAENLTGATPANAWPVGSVFFSAVSTNPNVLLGFGTWTQIAQGRLVGGVGQGTDIHGATLTIAEGNDTTVGEYRHTLVDSELAQHNHGGATSPGTATGSTSSGGQASGTTASGHAAISDPQHSHGGQYATGAGGAYTNVAIPGNDGVYLGTGAQAVYAAGTGISDSGHTHSVTVSMSSVGVSVSVPGLTIYNDPTSATQGHNNVPPFIGLYIWQRTA